MTLILELTPEQEQRLSREAASKGIDTQTLALRRLFGEEEAEWSGPSLADRLQASGALGAIEGKPRADGRNRSEIEAATDAAH